MKKTGVRFTIVDHVYTGDLIKWVKTDEKGKIIDIIKFLIGKFLGQGEFGKVYQILQYDSGGKNFACKMVRKEFLLQPDRLSRLNNEINVH